MATTLQVGPQPRLRRRRWALGLGVAALVAALTWPATSHVRALISPGQVSFLVRTVEWVRDNGGGMVDLLESWEGLATVGQRDFFAVTLR